MENIKKPFFFSEIITNEELTKWEEEHERMREIYYNAKESLSDEENKI